MNQNDVPRCKCGAAVQWSFCFDMFYDRDSGNYHPTEAFGSGECDLTNGHVCNDVGTLHKCRTCGMVIAIDCCCGATETVQPQFEGVEWDAEPNMVDA